jgi:hypothetical protein
MIRANGIFKQIAKAKKEGCQRRSQAEQGAGVRINRYAAFTIAPQLLEVGDQRRDLACRYSRQAAIRHPLVEQIDVRLRPGAVADRRGWRHDSAANSADPVVDGLGVGFHRVVAGEVEPRAHALDVAFGEQRKDVRLEAYLAAHGISDLRQGLGVSSTLNLCCKAFLRS